MIGAQHSISQLRAVESRLDNRIHKKMQRKVKYIEFREKTLTKVKQKFKEDIKRIVKKNYFKKES